ncbi:MAG: hypothetical protein C5B52_04025 [Bacteroidetes bacterium]|nr:MAG: hypothetical protein C5B52_04025 [Bacteroidota bacterium]
MLHPHIWLIIFWILFGVSHSLLASIWFKNQIRMLAGRSFKYYRIIYNLFSFLSLGLILYFQYSFSSPALWVSPYWITLPAFLFVALGGLIMLICITRYFLPMSGLSALRNKNEDSFLVIDGMHRFVRHPLYFGTLMLVWALFLIYPFLNNLICCTAITLYTFLGTVMEEKKLLIQFGNEYRKYQREVPMLVPFTKFARQ